MLGFEDMDWIRVAQDCRVNFSFEDMDWIKVAQDSRAYIRF